MAYIAQNLPYFIILIGPLIFFHELGHFLIAKLAGVRVLKFSLGFGPKLLGVKRGETEYVLAAIPLGGFVKMWGEDPTADIPPEERAGSFSHQPLYKRAAIVAAGPIFNLILAMAIYTGFALHGTPDGTTKLGMVMPGEPADRAGIKIGDEITAIDGKPVEYWNDLHDLIQDNQGAPMRVDLKRGGETVSVSVTPKLVEERDDLNQPVTRGRIGISRSYVAPFVDVPEVDSPAAKAGLKTGDEIVQVGATRIESWNDLCRALAAAPDEVTVKYRHDEDGAEETTTLRLLPQEVARHDQNLRPEPATRFSGLTSYDARVAKVVPDSPAAKAGLQVGDRLVGVEGKKLTAWRSDLAMLNGMDAQKPFTIAFARDDQLIERTVTLEAKEATDEFKQTTRTYLFGAENDPKTLRGYNTMRAYGVLGALANGAESTYKMSAMTLRGIGLMFAGKISVHNVGGPVMLFVVAEKSAARGAGAFLYIMALISINLGLMNLLPVPVLDGGHLLFFGVEALGRRPVPMRVREYATMAGLVLLFLLMALAFRNDFVHFIVG